MDISILQTSFLPTFYCMAIKVFIMRLIETYGVYMLYGDKGLSNDVNRDILQLTLQYIHKTG